MAGINDYSNTAGSNTTINGIDIAEGCSPAGINNAIRQLMADIADVDDGVVPLQTPDINGGTIDGAAISGSSTIDNSIIGGTTPAAGTFTTLTANTSIIGTLNTAAQPNITSVGTLTSATVSGDLTVDTNTLYVDSTNNRVGIGTSSPIEKLEVYGTEASGGVELLLTNVGDGGTTTTPYTAIRSRLNSIRNGGEIRFGRDNNYGSLADADSNIQFYTAVDDVNTERMRITSSGNVGIGTSSPTSLGGYKTIQTDATAGGLFDIKINGTRTFNIQSSSSIANIQTRTAIPIAFDINTSEAMRIDSSGRVGIGTTSPAVPLHAYATTAEIARLEGNDEFAYLGLRGTVSGSPTVLGYFGFGNDTGTAADLNINNSQNGGISFTANSSQRMFIGSNGHLYATCNDGSLANLTLRNGASGDTPDFFQCRDSANNLELVIEPDGDVKNVNNSYGATSDQKLKENIVDASSQWEDIKSLRVRKYNLIGNDNLHLGVVAQELETAGMNGLVKETVDKDSEGNDLGTTTKSVKYSILYMKAVKALQEAMQKIEDLEARVNTLEGN